MNKMSIYKNRVKNQKGFTLFIALIVSTILLSVGFSIGNIIFKQIQLSTAGRESQVAFYAADSAAECALYWDRKNGAGDSVIDQAFGTSTDITATQALGIKCGSGALGDGAVFIASKEIVGDYATTTFYIDYHDLTGEGYNSCAKVTVGRSPSYTAIDARGYNADFVTDDQCDVTNPRTVERGLFLLY